MSAGMEKPGVVEQVDLTPTLALGLGLPISQNSVGRVIPSVLEETSLRDQLRFLHLNGHQLSCLLKDSIPDYEKGRSQNVLCAASGPEVPESQDLFWQWVSSLFSIVSRVMSASLLTFFPCAQQGDHRLRISRHYHSLLVFPKLESSHVYKKCIKCSRSTKYTVNEAPKQLMAPSDTDASKHPVSWSRCFISIQLVSKLR